MDTPAIPLGHREERVRRIGLNEGVFRRVNEQLKHLAEEFEMGEEPLLLVCECGYNECDRRLQIPPREYQRVRSEDRAFFVVPGHELEEAEFVAERHETYNIVLKRPGVATDVAEATADD